MNKKFIKRFLSAFAAAAVSFSSLMSITSFAKGGISGPLPITNSSEELSEWLEGCTPLDEKYSFLYEGWWLADEVEVYYGDVGITNTTLRYVIPNAHEEEYITLVDGVSVEDANAFLKDFYNSGAIILVEKGTLSDGTPYYTPSGRADFVITSCKDLKDNGMLSGYWKETGFFAIGDMNFYTFLGYEEESFNGDEFAEVAAYVEAKGVGRVVDEGGLFRRRCIEACDGVTLAEQLEAALEIYEKFDVKPFGFQLDVPNNVVGGGVLIDCYNAIEGDANDDGEVDIADATLILQAIGNPDKYKLTPQGEYNADVDCSGGVTALDALEVQRIDAKLV